MGFTYVGPLEGHILSYLIKNFENIKDLTGPVLVHVITKKARATGLRKKTRLVIMA